MLQAEVIHICFIIVFNSNAYNRVIYSHVPQSLEQQKGQIVFLITEEQQPFTLQKYRRT